MPKVKNVKWIAKFGKAYTPFKATNRAAGSDLRSPVDVTIQPKGNVTIFTNLQAIVPDGTYLDIKERSGLARRGLNVGAGVVDAGYEGNVGIVLRNLSDEKIEIKDGDKIAQAVLRKDYNIRQVRQNVNDPLVPTQFCDMCQVSKHKDNFVNDRDTCEDCVRFADVTEFIRGENGFGSTDNDEGNLCKNCHNSNIVDNEKCLTCFFDEWIEGEGICALDPIRCKNCRYFFDKNDSAIRSYGGFLLLCASCIPSMEKCINSKQLKKLSELDGSSQVDLILDLYKCIINSVEGKYMEPVVCSAFSFKKVLRKAKTMSLRDGSKWAGGVLRRHFLHLPKFKIGRFNRFRCSSCPEYVSKCWYRATYSMKGSLCDYCFSNVVYMGEALWGAITIALCKDCWSLRDAHNDIEKICPDCFYLILRMMQAPEMTDYSLATNVGVKEVVKKMCQSYLNAIILVKEYQDNDMSFFDFCDKAETFLLEEKERSLALQYMWGAAIDDGRDMISCYDGKGVLRNGLKKEVSFCCETSYLSTLELSIENIVVCSLPNGTCGPITRAIDTSAPPVMLNSNDPKEIVQVFWHEGRHASVTAKMTRVELGNFLLEKFKNYITVVEQNSPGKFTVWKRKAVPENAHLSNLLLDSSDIRQCRHEQGQDINFNRAWVVSMLRETAYEK